MDPVLTGYRRLGCKILAQAYTDAAGGNAAARRWLSSSGAVGLVELLELDAGGLHNALAALPALASEQLPLPGVEAMAPLY